MRGRELQVFDAFWKGYGQYGFKTVWLDASEPERADSSMYNFGDFAMSAGTDTEVGEGWVREHVKSFAEGFAAKGIAASDYFVLPRHGWAGTWRYSAALWSGDTQSTFAELAMQIRVGQGITMSGVVLWTTDIGGYDLTGCRHSMVCCNGAGWHVTAVAGFLSQV